MKKLFIYLSLLLISLCVVGCKQDDEVKVYKPDLSNQEKYSVTVLDTTMQVTSLMMKKSMTYAPDYIGYLVRVDGQTLETNSQNMYRYFWLTFYIYCRDSIMIEPGIYPTVNLGYPNQPCMMLSEAPFCYYTINHGQHYIYDGIRLPGSLTVNKSGEDYTVKFEGLVSICPGNPSYPADLMSFTLTLNEKMLGNKYEEPY